MIMEKGKDLLMAYLAGLKKNQLFLDVFTVFSKWGTKTSPTGEVTEKLSNSSADRTKIEVKDTTNFMNFTD